MRATFLLLLLAGCELPQPNTGREGVLYVLRHCVVNCRNTPNLNNDQRYPCLEACGDNYTHDIAALRAAEAKSTLKPEAPE